MMIRLTKYIGVMEKRRFRICGTVLIMMLSLISTISARNVVMTFTGYANEITEVTQDGITILGDKGSALTPSRVWNEEFRVYNGSVVTFKTVEDELITKIIFGDGSSIDWNGQPTKEVVINSDIKGEFKTITVETQNNTGDFVAVPVFSHQSGVYSSPFDLSITAESGAEIKYTLDGSVPNLNEGIVYDGSAIRIDKTTSVKAIALKNGKSSAVTDVTYTFIALVGDGSLANPYIIEDVDLLPSGTEGWFKGTILGSYGNGGIITETPVNTNMAVGTENLFVPVQLPSSPLRDAVNPKENDVIGKTIRFYGEKAEYFSNPNGIKNVSQVADLYSIEVSDAGYSTYYANHAFVVPEGIKIGIISGINVKNNILTIDWKYAFGDIVPANTAVIIEGKANNYPYIVDDSKSSSPTGNLLKGTLENAMTEGENCVFYKLAYDQQGENLGFYWGAENGAAFMNQAYKAYLALPQAQASEINGFLIDTDGGTTGVTDIQAKNIKVDVYTLGGVLIRQQVEAVHALDGLQKGIYIVNGKKIIK